MTARQGDVIAIIGGSGSGKSTFLRCINMLELPSAGTITIHGETIGMKKDGQGGLMPADRRPVAYPASWAAYAAARDRPFFTNFGCYAYGGEPGEWRAKARADGSNGPRDYAVTFAFSTGPDGKAMINGIALTPAAATPADFGCR